MCMSSPRVAKPLVQQLPALQQAKQAKVTLKPSTQVRDARGTKKRRRGTSARSLTIARPQGVNPGTGGVGAYAPTQIP